MPCKMFKTTKICAKWKNKMYQSGNHAKAKVDYFGIHFDIVYYQCFSLRDNTSFLTNETKIHRRNKTHFFFWVISWLDVEMLCIRPTHTEWNEPVSRKFLFRIYVDAKKIIKYNCGNKLNWYEFYFNEQQMKRENKQFFVRMYFRWCVFLHLML